MIGHALRPMTALLLLLAGGAAAPGPSLRFERVGAEQGLSQESAMAIAQDARGFVWVGTQAGLNRYDGYRFTTFRHDPADPTSLADPWVYALHLDAQGRFWVGTAGGLQRWDPDRRAFVTYDAGNPRARNTRAIAGDGAGGLWIGTLDGLAHLDPATGRFAWYRAAPDDSASLIDDRVAALAVTRTGDLWVGTPGGVSLLRRGATRFQRFRLDSPGAPVPARNEVRSLLATARGDLWIGTDDGVEHWSGDGARRQHFGAAEGLVSSGVRALREDPAGRVWVGLYEKGLARWDPATDRFAFYRSDPLDPHSLGSDFVISLFVDRTGDLWVGGWFRGVSHTDLASGGFDRIVHRSNDPASLSDDRIARILVDSSGRLWLGTRAGGLDLFDRATGTATVFRHDSASPRSIRSDFVVTLVDAGGGRLWVGTEKGLDLFDPRTRVFTHLTLAPTLPHGQQHDEIRAMIRDQRDPHGTLWIGTQSELIRFDPATREVRRFANDPADPRSLGFPVGINALLLDQRGRLWVATYGGGLDRLDLLGPDGAAFSHFRHDARDPRSLRHDRVYALFEDRGGTIWVATADGLDRLAEDAGGRPSFAHFHLRDDVPDEPVYSMAQDLAGNLWVGTGAGLSRLDAATSRFRNYSSADGLIDGTYVQNSVFQGRDGTLYFGGFEGVTVFRPEAIHDNPSAPEVAITDLLIFNRSVLAGPRPAGFALRGALERAREVTLSYRHSVFAIEFAALHFADPARNRYAYKLEGFDRDWVFSDGSHRLATYTNLDPARYVFRVKAANKDGVWNDAGVSLAITIVPPFWKTWWFRAAAALLLAGIVGAGYRARVRAFARQRALLERQVAERTGELRRTHEELQEAHRALEEVSVTDSLTGLRNRRFVQQQLEPDVALAVRRYEAWLAEPAAPPPTQADLVFFLVDLDHFKAINDTHGHAAGDRVLQQMARRLRSIVRDSDVLVRWGGEEFLIVARGLQRDEAPALAERIRALVAVRPFELGEGLACSTSCSIGFTPFPLLPAHPRLVPWAQVLELADQALYAAKRGGRDAWVGLSATERCNVAGLPQRLVQATDDAVRTGELRVASSVADVSILSWSAPHGAVAIRG